MSRQKCVVCLETYPHDGAPMVRICPTCMRAFKRCGPTHWDLVRVTARRAHSVHKSKKGGA